MRIGVFDSGIGGLSVVKSLFDFVSGLDIIYFADICHMPYGEKSRNEILHYSQKIVDFFCSKDLNFIVSACGTVSSLLSFLNSKKEIMGVIEPSCVCAYKISQNKKIGIIATSLSIKIGEYKRFLQSLDTNLEIFTSSCPRLASMIEKSFKNKNGISQYIKSCIQPMINNNIDTLILGCTHYPLIKDIIIQEFPGLNIVDSSFETARYIHSHVNKIRGISQCGTNNLKIYSSKLSNDFIQNASNIMNFDCSYIVEYKSL